MSCTTCPAHQPGPIQRCLDRMMARFYDASMKRSEAAGLADWRRQQMALASGAVLEIGAGTGANLPYYTEAVEHLVLTEPQPDMLNQLRARAASHGLNAQIIGAPAEALPCEDASIDTVVCSLVLCSVRDLQHTLHEIKRVLRPGGRLLFIEHVGAPRGSRLRLWQRLLQPLWRRLAGNCHTTRDTESALQAAGFVLDVEHVELPETPAFNRVAIRGIAQKGQ